MRVTAIKKHTYASQVREVGETYDTLCDNDGKVLTIARCVEPAKPGRAKAKSKVEVIVEAPPPEPPPEPAAAVPESTTEAPAEQPSPRYLRRDLAAGDL